MPVQEHELHMILERMNLEITEHANFKKIVFNSNASHQERKLDGTSLLHIPKL